MPRTLHKLTNTLDLLPYFNLADVLARAPLATIGEPFALVRFHNFADGSSSAQLERFTSLDPLRARAEHGDSPIHPSHIKDPNPSAFAFPMSSFGADLLASWGLDASGRRIPGDTDTDTFPAHWRTYRRGTDKVLAVVHPSETDELGRPTFLVLDPRTRELSIATAEELESTSKTDKLARAWEYYAYGVDNAQYFTGDGAGDFDDVYIGVGSSEREALDDALECAASSGWDVELAALEIERDENPSTDDEVSATLAEHARGRQYRVRFMAHFGFLRVDALFADAASALEKVRSVIERHARLDCSAEGEGDAEGDYVRFELVNGSLVESEFEGGEEGDPSEAYDERGIFLPHERELEGEYDTVSDLCDVLASYQWETREPEGCAMIPDTAGTLTLDVLAGDTDVEGYGDDSELHYYVSVRVSERNELASDEEDEPDERLAEHNRAIGVMFERFEREESAERELIAKLRKGADEYTVHYLTESVDVVGLLRAAADHIEKGDERVTCTARDCSKVLGAWECLASSPRFRTMTVADALADMRANGLI